MTIKNEKCGRCGHSLSGYSQDAYCTRLTCLCHPHGACSLPPVVTSERLRRAGYDHAPGSVHGKRHIVRDGEIVVPNVTAFEANDWLDAHQQVQRDLFGGVA